MVSNDWTRIFTRGGVGGKRVALWPMGSDLIYDKSVRDLMS